MNLVEIPEREIKIEVPDHWDEMTPEQVDFCLQQAVHASLGVIEVLEAKLKCLYFLLDIQRDWKTERWERINSKDLVKHKNVKIFLLAERLITFLFKENEEGKLEVNFNTLTNHFPELTAGKTTLYGCADMLTDLTFGEFRAAVEEMNEYFATKDQNKLSRMIACLYRPAPEDLPNRRKSLDWDGKTREPFYRARITENAIHATKLSVAHRNGILLWFTFCLNFIQKNELTIGGSEVDFRILFSGGSEGSGTGWTGVLYAIAEKGIFGNTDQADQAGLFDVLLYMYDKELENRKIKAKSKKK
tara:strand:+ start:20441 stop:21346 length:906 start_codon:yes stop_codon:yes gene_type:complete